MSKRSSIIPAGDFEKVQEQDQEEFEQKQKRKAKWCKYCGRKHGKREDCEMLSLEEDLTHPSTNTNADGDLILNVNVGYYTTRFKETR